MINILLKPVSLFFAAAVALTSCTKTNDPGKCIIIYAGAGMKTPLEQISRDFTAASGIQVLHDFQGSGALLNKIASGNAPDIYIPASEVWINRCAAKHGVAKTIKLAYHVPVLVFNPDKVKIASLHDLVRSGIPVSLGIQGVAAIGDTALSIFSKAGITKSDINIVANAHTVKQIVYYVKQGHAEAGIVWMADALEEPELRYIAIPEKYCSAESIPLCILEGDTARRGMVNRYTLYMIEHGLDVFSRYGFKQINQNKENLIQQSRI